MKIQFKSLIVAIAVVTSVQAYGQYRDHATLSRDLNDLARSYPTISELTSLVKTEGGKDIWLLTIGTGNKHEKPGIAVFGGVEGNHLLGIEMAAGFAEHLLRDSETQEVRDLLSNVTFYVFPNVSPDASQQYFADLRYDRKWNARPVEANRANRGEGVPFSDLNGDGYITMMRVEHPAGTHVPSRDDPRVMVRADLARGERGLYLMFPEGAESNNGGRPAENIEGGVNFNNNWSFNYQEFGRHAGPHAVSEPETEAVAEFLFDHFNIYAVFAFGPQDNLAQPMRSGERRAGTREITSILRTDETINRLVSSRYREVTGVRGTPVTTNVSGNFMEWAYFHYGRYSFSTPGWWFPQERGANSEVAFLKYAEESGRNDIFVPWQEVNHPDFPERKVEVGGIKPFVMTNPPAEMVSGIVESNYRFVKEVAGMHPDLQFIDIEVDNVGSDIYRLTLSVHNRGFFATIAEIGAPNQFVRLPRITLELARGQEILSGDRVQQLGRIEGTRSREFIWLIRGRGNIDIRTGDINTGVINTTVNIR